MEQSSSEVIELLKQQNELTRNLVEASTKEAIALERLKTEQEETRKKCEEAKKSKEELISLEQRKIKEVEESIKTNKELSIAINNLIIIVTNSINSSKSNTDSINTVLRGLQVVSTMIGTELLKLLVREEVSKDQCESLTQALIAIGEAKGTVVDLGFKANRDIITGDHVGRDKTDINR